LSGGVDLSAVHLLQVAIDDAAPVVIDFAAAGLGHAGTTAKQIADAINAATGAASASAASGRLTLVSATQAAQGSVAVVPIEAAVVRSFVSRCFASDEASEAVLGSFAADATGSNATAG